MLTSNNVIFSSQAALNGSWRNIQNWINFSLQVVNFEGNVWVEVSNDPNVATGGANIAAPAAPVLSQYTPISDSHIGGVPVNTTYYVKNTYITPNGGETVASAEASLLVTAGNLLVVQSPVPDVTRAAVGWNTYISTTTGTGHRLQNLENNAVIAPCQLSHSFIVTNWGLTASGSVVPSSNTSAQVASGFNLTGNLAAGTYVLNPALNQVQVYVTPAVTSPPFPSMAIINPSSLSWNYIRVCKDGTANTKVTTAYLFGQSV